MNGQQSDVIHFPMWVIFYSDHPSIHSNFIRKCCLVERRYITKLVGHVIVSFDPDAINQLSRAWETFDCIDFPKEIVGVTVISSIWVVDTFRCQCCIAREVSQLEHAERFVAKACLHLIEFAVILFQSNRYQSIFVAFFQGKGHIS